MSTIKLGNIELIPIHRDFSSYKEFLDWSDSLGDGLKRADYKTAKYIISLKKLSIFQNIRNNYSVNLVSEIILQVEDDFGFSRDGLSVLIDDPIEIEKFLNGEDATGMDKEGEEIVINKGDNDIIDWEGETSISFIIRTI